MSVVLEGGWGAGGRRGHGTAADLPEPGVLGDEGVQREAGGGIYGEQEQNKTINRGFGSIKLGGAGVGGCVCDTATKIGMGAIAREARVVVSCALPPGPREVEEVDQNNAERPHVAGERVVLQSGMDLGSGIERGAGHAIANVADSGCPKVNELDVTTAVEAAVLQLDVPMADVLGLQIVQAGHYLLEIAQPVCLRQHGAIRRIQLQ